MAATKEAQEQARQQERDRAAVVALILASLPLWGESLDALAARMAAKQLRGTLEEELGQVFSFLPATLVNTAVAAALASRLRVLRRLLALLESRQDLRALWGTRWRERLAEALRTSEEVAWRIRNAVAHEVIERTQTLVAHVAARLRVQDISTTAEAIAALEAAGVRTNPFAVQILLDAAAHDAYQEELQEVHEDPLIREILQGYEYVSMRDSRVRPTHRAADGTFVQPGDSSTLSYLNGLLQEWGCRCSLVPIYGNPHLPPQLI